MKKPTNTTREATLFPGAFLLDALIAQETGRNPIEAQEAQGQRELVNSASLPTQILHADGGEGVLQAWGVKLGDPPEDDPIFRPAELPEGWKLVATDHAMWSHLIDDKGRQRAAIFYKAAFYDRSAHMDLCSRYTIRRDWEAQDATGKLTYHVFDGETVLFTADNDVSVDGSLEAERSLDARCVAWLAERGIEDHRNPRLHWERE